MFYGNEVLNLIKSIAEIALEELENNYHLGLPRSPVFTSQSLPTPETTPSCFLLYKTSDTQDYGFFDLNCTLVFIFALETELPSSFKDDLYSTVLSSLEERNETPHTYFYLTSVKPEERTDVERKTRQFVLSLFIKGVESHYP